MLNISRRQFGGMVGMGAAATLLPHRRAKAQEVLRFSHIAAEDNTWHLGALEFARLVEEKTDGEVVVEVFPNSSLGTERETLEGIPLGLADLTITSDSMAQWAPSILAMSHAFLFRDSEHVLRFMESEIARGIEQDVINQARLRPIAYFLRGPRYLTSSRPVRTIDDAQGFKLRVPNVPMFVADWSAIGANPTPMAFAEVFGAMQQGVIDGQENPFALIHSAKFYEVQSHLNLTAHVRQAIYVVIGEDRLMSLSEPHQEAVLSAAAEMQDYERQLFLDAEGRLETELQELGMEFVPTELGPFREAVANVVEEQFPELADAVAAIGEL